MSERQWQKTPCVNCNELRRDWGTTRYFAGLISLMMASNSWVAQFNGLKHRKPGVYAIRILQEDYYDEDDPYDEYGQKKKKAKRKRAKAAYGREPDIYSDDASQYYSEDDEEDLYEKRKGKGKYRDY